MSVIITIWMIMLSNKKRDKVQRIEETISVYETESQQKDMYFKEIPPLFSFANQEF